MPQNAQHKQKLSGAFSPTAGPGSHVCGYHATKSMKGDQVRVTVKKLQNQKLITEPK